MWDRRKVCCWGTVLFSLAGLVPALSVLVSGRPLEIIPGQFQIDALSAFFLTAILSLSGLTAIYQWGYLKGQKYLTANIPFFPLLVFSMALVVTAVDGFVFLVCWEVMSLASFFLVTAEHETPKVRQAGWIYLIATHLATFFLIVFFIVLQEKAGSFAFSDFVRSVGLSPPLAGFLFFCALIGFGTKAGLFPFHVWLPHAHPAAPSPVSALMSGVMIKTGIYGLIRAFTFLGTPPVWWGEVLIALGIVSSIVGMLYGLLKSDLKSLLAYSSVKNIGIIVTGLGLGLLGQSLHQPVLEILGFAGALFHVINHALFKGLLFLGAGSVIHAVHTRAIDRMGGLLKKMPWTGSFFLVASAAICGLPPLNGFVSEWLIYIGLFKGCLMLTHLPLFLCVAGVVGIAFAGGLAVACFTKLFGTVFLGEPRDPSMKDIHEAPGSMLVPMGVLAFLCLGLGIYPQVVLGVIVSIFSGVIPPGVVVALQIISGLFLVLAVLMILGGLWLRKKTVSKTVTWDCGFARPTPRMQYTSSSFAEPISVFFKALLRPAVSLKRGEGFFAPIISFEERIVDFSEQSWFAPLFVRIGTWLAWVRRLQRPQIQHYLMLIFFTLIVLLLWEAWFGI